MLLRDFESFKLNLQWKLNLNTKIPAIFATPPYWKHPLHTNKYSCYTNYLQKTWENCRKEEQKSHIVWSRFTNINPSHMAQKCGHLVGQWLHNLSQRVVEAAKIAVLDKWLSSLNGKETGLLPHCHRTHTSVHHNCTYGEKFTSQFLICFTNRNSSLAVSTVKFGFEYFNCAFAFSETVKLRCL